MEAVVTVSSSCCCLAVHSTKGAAICRGLIPIGSGRRCLYIERKRFVFRCKLSKQRRVEEGFAARPKNPDNKKVSLMVRVEQTVKKLLRKKAVVMSLWLATGTMFVVTVCYLACRWKATSMPAPALVPYSHLVTTLETGAVSTALFEEGSKRIFYRLNNHQPQPQPQPQPQHPIGEQRWHFLTRRIDNDEGYLLGLMRGHGVTYSSAPVPLSSSLSKLAFTLASLWIPLMPLMWLVHKQISGNSSSQRRASTQQSVTFEDIEGVDAAKAELMEIVQCLQGAINYRKLGASLPKGVLLVGQPGTGKTLLARAVAGEAGVPFYTTSASEFVELFVGRGASRIRDLFKVARKCAPSIIFIDEIDAVGGRRGRSFNDERDQTLNQLLTEMDGFESNNGVLVIAATNRADALDPALCRPGRFNRRVIVKEPDLDGRKRILSVHLRDILLEDDPELVCNCIASATSGFVGADLANVVNEAALLAARNGKNAVTLEYFKEAVHRAKYGIGDEVVSPTNIGKEVGKLLSWIPSRVSMNVSTDNQPMGYQTLT